MTQHVASAHLTFELNIEDFSTQVAPPTVTNHVDSRRPYHGTMLTYVENTCQEEISNIALYRVNIEKFEAAFIFTEGIRTEGLTGRTVVEKANDFLSYLEVKSRYSKTTVA